MHPGTIPQLKGEEPEIRTNLQTTPGSGAKTKVFALIEVLLAYGIL